MSGGLAVAAANAIPLQAARKFAFIVVALSRKTPALYLILPRLPSGANLNDDAIQNSGHLEIQARWRTPKFLPQSM